MIATLALAIVAKSLIVELETTSAGLRGVDVIGRNKGPSSAAISRTPIF